MFITSRIEFITGICCLFFLLHACTPPPSAPPQIVQLAPEEAAAKAQEIRSEVAASVGDGLELSLWASDTLLADPIAISMDDQGNMYVTRTQRQKNSEFDIRGHMDWVPHTIAFETVEDRRDFLHKEFSPENSEKNAWLPDLNGDGLHDWKDLAVEQEEVYRISDQSGDGIADMSQLFLKDFNQEITDVAGAVLAYEGELFVGVGPDVWRIKDTDGDGTADHKTSISHGYAVHIGFSGHGMSGLTLGPDGKIYWSIGDIGFNVVDPSGKRWAYPNQGGIFRANPDGSDFEVFAAGLRNTHEFVFDEYGNLFSVDNDGDHAGESERLVYIVQGSDAGWRSSWQYGKYTDDKNNAYKVWMDERLYVPRWEGQAAYIIPPIRNYHNGPTGMLYNPGTALNERWKQHFFVVEFIGSPSRAAVYGFRLKPEGAGFAFRDEQKILGNVLATGLEFGPEGTMYVADWINGWGTKDRGRIWKLDVPGGTQQPLRKETRALLGEEFETKSPEELQALLGHADSRVRRKAQFALVKLGPIGQNRLLAAIQQTENQMARVHGIWGIGQLARKKLETGERLIPFLTAKDAEIRAQSAKILGDVRFRRAGNAIVPLLKDPSPRVRFFAAEALGRISYQPAVSPILEMLAENADKDLYLRHAGALALARIGDAESLVELNEHPSSAVRLAAVLALRRMRHPGLATYLQDPDEYIVAEAARAIHDDRSVEEAMPALARVLREDRFSSEPLLRRALSANLRLGTQENWEILADFALRPTVEDALRVEAIASLGVSPHPSPLDRVEGRYRGEVTRDPSEVVAAVESILPRLWITRSGPLREATAQTVAQLHIRNTDANLLQWVTEDPLPEVRAAALSALATLESRIVAEALPVALNDTDEAVRMNAIQRIPEVALPERQTVPLLVDIIENASQGEAQSALATLGNMEGETSAQALEAFWQEAQTGTFDLALRLELTEAVGSRPSLQESLETLAPTSDLQDPLQPYLAALEGGDPRQGAQVFYRNSAAQCARCHAIGGRGGEVGPSLTQIGNVLSREDILLSLVEPSARIAPGYGMLSLTLEGDQSTSGILTDETSNYVIVKTSDAEPVRIPKSKILQRRNAPSSMPAMGGLLNQRELRDLVAFLTSLKGEVTLR